MFSILFSNLERSTASSLASRSSAFDYVQSEAAERRFLVVGFHIHAGLIHGSDDLVERDFVVARFAHGDSASIHGLHGAHGIAFYARNLNQSADWIARHAEVVLHADLAADSIC